MQKVRCDICGDEVKNLGVHKYHKHKETIAQGSIIPVDNPFTVDIPTEKPLSEIIDEIKNLLKRYRFTVKVSYEEEDVNINNIEILARFQIRR